MKKTERYSRWKGAVHALRLAMGVCVFFSLTVRGVAAETLSVTYSFADPVVVPVSDSRVAVSVVDCDTLHAVGQPRIPFRTARIVLPPGARVGTVDAEALAPEQVLLLEQPLDYGRPPIPLGFDDPAAMLRAQQALPDSAVYGVDAPYPERRAELISVQRMHGFDIAIVRLYPAQYRPVSSQLLFVQDLVCTVTLVDGLQPMKALASVLPTGVPERRQCVMDFVDNPDLIQREPGRLLKPMGGSEIYDYLLVTAAALTNAFQPLVAHKTALGLAVKVATVEEVLLGQEGVDDAEKLRTYIRQAYDDWDTKYVLLGGDVGVVPHRGVYVKTESYIDEQMPSDVYFACLDGSWNSNSNSYWGEVTDGEVGEADIDLLPEVFVGRAPVNDTNEVARFVEKTLRYALGGHENAEEALFVGEYLGSYSGAHPQGGKGLDPLLPSFNDFTVDWLDDRPTNGEVWKKADIVAALNASPHLVAHHGHSSATTAMRMDRDDAGELQNTSLFLLNSAGCNAGAFDTPSGDSFTETILKAEMGGAVAAIMNTRLGWFFSGDEKRFSGEFMQKFFKRLLEQGAPNIGTAHFLGKEEMVGSVERSDSAPYRWCYLGNTLFGDPHLALQTDALCVETTGGLLASGYAGGPFSPLSKLVTLTNTSTGVLSWASVVTNDWLFVSPASGTVEPGTNVVVTVAFSPSADLLNPGTYAETIVFSNTVSGYARGRDVDLRVYGSLIFEPTAYSVMESLGAQATLTVVRTGNTETAATVDYKTRDGSAIAGLDYVGATGTLTFADGDTKQTIVIDLINDDVFELEEVFYVVLENPTGMASIEPPGEARVTIHDDDWPDRFEWEPIGSPQQVGTPFEVSVAALDRAGVLYPSFTDDCELHILRGEPIVTEMPGLTNLLEYPMASLAKYARSQVIYTPEEVGGPGLLTGLSLNAYYRPSVPLDDWTIRIKETTLQHYDSANRQWETNDWVVVLQMNLSVPKNGLKRFDFTQPFVYSGTNNLLVDYSFSNDSVSGMTQSGFCTAALVETNRCFFAKNGGEFGDPLQWSGQVPFGKIGLKIPGAYFERRELVWSAPSRTEPFVDGVWTGDVVVRESGTNLYLATYSGFGQEGVSAPFAVAWPGLSVWLAAYGLPNDGSADDADSDCDGFTNREEWLAGTNPTNKLSRLSIEAVSVEDTDGAFRLRWQSVPGKRYRVERAGQLGYPFDFEVVRSNILGTASTTEAVDSEAAEGAGFYRIGVEP